MTLTLTRCPKAPDGQHVPTARALDEQDRTDERGRPLEGTYRLVCLLCQEEVGLTVPPKDRSVAESQPATGGDFGTQ